MALNKARFFLNVKKQIYLIYKTFALNKLYGSLTAYIETCVS